MQNAITPIDIVPLQEAIKARLAGSSNGKTTDFESVNEVDYFAAAVPLASWSNGRMYSHLYRHHIVYYKFYLAAMLD